MRTTSAAGADAVYDAAFRRAGMLRVYSLEELFDAAETLAMGCRPKGDRLAILTNGGGIGTYPTLYFDFNANEFTGNEMPKLMREDKDGKSNHKFND